MRISSLVILAIILTACDSAKSPKNIGSPLPQQAPIGASSAKSPENTVDLLLRRMQSELPKGWRASCKKHKYSVLEISRDEILLAIPVFINGPLVQKPEETKFTFVLRVIPFVPPGEHRRLNAENVRIQKQLSTLYDELDNNIRISHKYDRFFAETDEDKAAVARYDLLKKSLHSLPDYYFEDISLEWAYGWLFEIHPGVEAGIDILDERIRKECTDIQNKVLALLSKYEGA